ncbi:uncharacterized protein LOC143290373 [Babylonia areolata]|uniref:uncharacterized protein LOC143290373 n=1 Tax=Babylonia areolata TaxID=304850 RepID=UPI003FD0A229
MTETSRGIDVIPDKVRGGMMEQDRGSEVSQRSSGSSGHQVTPSWRQLRPLRTRVDVQRFLRAILQNFVDKVEIETYSLLDELRAMRVVTDRDAESLGGLHLPTRNEKARRLWNILCSIDHKVFVEKALPVLCRHYSFIIPEGLWLDGNAAVSGLSQWGTGEDNRAAGRHCVRCSIKERIRPTDLADLLMEAGFITLADYKDIIDRYRNPPTDWPRIFRAFRKLAGREASSHVDRIRRLMADHSLAVPDDLLPLVEQGFPCSCASGRKHGQCDSPATSEPTSSRPVSTVSEGCYSTLSFTSASSHSDGESNKNYLISGDENETSGDTCYVNIAMQEDATETSDGGGVKSELLRRHADTVNDKPVDRVGSYFNLDESKKERRKIHSVEIPVPEKIQKERKVRSVEIPIPERKPHGAEQTESELTCSISRHQGEDAAPEDNSHQSSQETTTAFPTVNSAHDISEILIDISATSGLCARCPPCPSRLCGENSYCGRCVREGKVGLCLCFLLVVLVLTASILLTCASFVPWPERLFFLIGAVPSAMGFIILLVLIIWNLLKWCRQTSHDQ